MRILYCLESYLNLWILFYTCNIRLRRLLFLMSFLAFWRYRIFLLWLYYILFIFYSCFCDLMRVCSPNIDEVGMCFNFQGCLWLLMILVVPSIFLILSLFLNCSRFFIISVNITDLLYIERYAKGSSLLCFLGVVVLLIVFSTNSNPLFINVVWDPRSWSVTRNFSMRIFQRLLLVTMMDILHASM